MKKKQLRVLGIFEAELELVDKNQKIDKHSNFSLYEHKQLSKTSEKSKSFMNTSSEINPPAFCVNVLDVLYQRQRNKFFTERCRNF